MKTTYNHLTHSYETPDKTTVAAEICEGDTPSDAFRAAAIREQQRTWVGLTDEEIFTELERVDPETKRLPAGLKIFAHYLEARLKEKNNAS